MGNEEKPTGRKLFFGHGRKIKNDSEPQLGMSNSHAIISRTCPQR